MLDSLRVKFTTHQDLRKQLLDTGDKILVEHSPRDPYWGDGYTDPAIQGTGENKLGVILMQV